MELAAGTRFSADLRGAAGLTSKQVHGAAGRCEAFLGLLITWCSTDKKIRERASSTEATESLSYLIWKVSCHFLCCVDGSHRPTLAHGGREP